MNNPNSPDRLEDVLNAYVASDDGPDASLDDWIRRYPQYEQELTEFAISWSLMESLPPEPDTEEVGLATLVLRGMSVVQNLLHSQSSESASVSVRSFESLIAEGRVNGLEPRQLAQISRLGVSLLRKLDRRLIRYASIPRAAIRGLAEAIRSDEASVSAYLQQSPALAAATEHRSEQAPALAEPEDFFDAVRADPTISPGDAAHWLEIQRPLEEA